MIPFAIGGVAGILKFFTGVDFGETTWYNAIAQMFLDMLVYAGIGSILFKFYKTTLTNGEKPITEAIKNVPLINKLIQ